MGKILGASLLILWLLQGWVNGQQEKNNQQQVKQSPPSLIFQEGETSVLNCTYENTLFDYFPWYRQYPGEGPVLLVAIRSVESKKENGRFTAVFSKSDKQISLHIKPSQPADSATYFCAASHFNIFYFGSGTKLIVKPNITDPQPAVYQLRSSDSKSSKLSMCLLTDFDSQTNVSQRTESETVFTSHTVLNMKSLDSKSYGALAWSQNSRLSCQDAFSNHTFLSSSDASCDAKLVEKSFETDMNLNFQNLSVIGLRLLLLKVAGFNLLMTLRLWSS